MGYETLVLPVGDWKLQFNHNDSETRVSIIDSAGVYKYITISMAQAQQLKRHLNMTLPFDQDHDKL